MSLPWLQDDFDESSRSRSGSPLDEKEVAKKELPRDEKEADRKRSPFIEKEAVKKRSPIDEKEVVKKEAVVDTPVQPFPQKSAQKSLSRSYRSRDRSRSSKRSRDSSRGREKRGRSSRHSKRKRRDSSSSSSSSRSSRSYSSRSSSSDSVPTRIIASTKQKFEKARIYVTNIVSKDINRQDLIKRFKKYGEVVDMILHVKNYAVIQFAKEEQAQNAIEGERGKTFRGWRIGICLASERPSQLKETQEENEKLGPQGRKWGPRGPKPARAGQRLRQRQGELPPHQEGPPPHQRGPPPHHGGPFPPPQHGGPFPPAHFEGPYPPPHFEGPFPPPHHGGPYPPPHHGGPFPPPHFEGPFPPHPREPGPDPFFGRRLRGPPGPFGPGPGDFRGMDPYFEDPFRPGPPEPWMGDAPFRPNTFDGPYMEPPNPNHPAECEIYIGNATLRPYGEYVEERIKNFSIVTRVSVRPPSLAPLQLLEDLKDQKVLFVIFIAVQNEKHKSVTLNILHGSPEEHRNMPLDDAVSYVLTSFRKYVEELKLKASKAGDRQRSPDRASCSFLPASPEVSCLINLLADNRNLTVEELNTIIQYLEKRRDKLIDPRSRSMTNKDKSPSGRRSADNSPESRGRSLENHHRSLEQGRRSPEADHRRPLEAGNRRSLEDGRGRSPGEGYRKSPQSYRRSPAMDLEEVSQSPKEEVAAASKAPSLLTEDLKTKILNILNSMRSTQNVPAADVEQPQPMFPAAVSTAASQSPVPRPPPLPSSLPSLPANEFDNFNNSGTQDSTKIFQNSSGFVNSTNSGFVDGVQGSNSTSAAPQPTGASNFPSSLGTVNEDGYQQGAWQGAYGQGAYDQGTYDQIAYDQGTYDQGAWMQGTEQNWRMQPEMEQTAPGTTGAPYQEAYNYPGSHNQMGQTRNNFGQPRY